MPDDVVLKIEKLAYGGEGLGFVDGKVCFVEGALPGETVRARVSQSKQNYAKGRLLEVLEKSHHREEPPCPYVQDCGGCQYQHLAYSEELRWKEIQVREHLERFLKLPGSRVSPIRSGASPYGYRNSVTLHETAPSPKPQQFGFVGRDNRTTLCVDNCLITDPRLRPVFTEKRLLRKGEDRISLRVGENGMIFSGREDQLFSMRIGDESILTSSRGFFQNNLEITRQIGQTARAWVQSAQPRLFADLYAGAGTFTILAAEGVPELMCLEESPASFGALKENFRIRGLKADLIEGLAEKSFPRYLKRKPRENIFVFVDPPRTGMSADLSEFLAQEPSLRHLVYLSCHLGTLTRDLGRILAKKRHEILEVIPFDMFPRTKHIEAAVFMRRL
ncbi:MAG: class I SAM-dependent RNA methyltransferase [Candidatus Omnitrophica bacterium]|nr:class I SAM-dependent RNA methyltransferase [Candidatus Omnitrophota bacterium]